MAAPERVTYQAVIAQRLVDMPQLNWTALAGLSDDTWDALMKILNSESLMCAPLELALTALRKSLLENLDDVPVTGRGLAFLSGLATFCFDSEFVFYVTPDETRILETLNPEQSLRHTLILSCYKALWPEDLPLSEIKSVSAVKDHVSQAVQSQYEENPYPRWQELPTATSPPDQIRQDILIAGCGSGRHAIYTAQQSPLARVVGIDLSRASLAYGLMKMREYSVTNLELFHCDILDVALLGQTFDTISSVGVLHHMSEPLNGLRALKKVLRPNGGMKIAVYTAAGRAAILDAIALRQQWNAPATPEGIRQFRQEIFKLPKSHPAKGVLMQGDFYSLSGTRDLLFNVQEHNYTIPMLLDLIAAGGMKLVHFGADEAARRAFQNMGFSDPLDMAGWEAVEAAQPGILGTMYRAGLVHAE